MTRLFKSRQQLTTALLVIVIIIMMVQNFLLVRKNNHNVERMERISAELTRLTVLNPGNMIRPFTARGLDSSKVTVELASQSRPTVLLAFTTWCGACLENLSNWKLLAHRISLTKVRMIGICPDSVSKIREYAQKHALSFPILSVLKDTMILDELKLHSFPQTILIDADGKVISVGVGVLNGKKVQDICDLIEKGRVETQPAP